MTVGKLALASGLFFSFAGYVSGIPGALGAVTSILSIAGFTYGSSPKTIGDHTAPPIPEDVDIDQCLAHVEKLLNNRKDIYTPEARGEIHLLNIVKDNLNGPENRAKGRYNDQSISSSYSFTQSFMRSEKTQPPLCGSRQASKGTKSEDERRCTHCYSKLRAKRLQ